MSTTSRRTQSQIGTLRIQQTLLAEFEQRKKRLEELRPAFLKEGEMLKRNMDNINDHYQYLLQEFVRKLENPRFLPNELVQEDQTFENEKQLAEEDLRMLNPLKQVFESKNGLPENLSRYIHEYQSVFRFITQEMLMNFPLDEVTRYTKMIYVYQPKYLLSEIETKIVQTINTVTEYLTTLNTAEKNKESNNAELKRGLFGRLQNQVRSIVERPDDLSYLYETNLLEPPPEMDETAKILSKGFQFKTGGSRRISSDLTHHRRCSAASASSLCKKKKRSTTTVRRRRLRGSKRRH